MLDNEDIKLIKKYAILPKLAMATIIVAIAIGVEWVLIEMLASMVFHEEGFNTTNLYVYLAIVIVYTIFGCYGILVSRIGMIKNKRWLALIEKLQTPQENSDYSGAVAGVIGAKAAGHLLEKAGSQVAKNIGSALDVAGTVGSIAVVGSITSEMSKNARAVANAVGVKLPKLRKYVLPIVLVPIIILGVSAVPRFMAAKAVMNESINMVNTTISELNRVYDSNELTVSADSPSENYDDTYNYTVRLEGDNTWNSGLYLTIDKNGVITEASYSYYVDINISLDENIAAANSIFEKLGGPLTEANVKFNNNALKTVHSLSEEFITTLKEGDYYSEARSTEDLEDGSTLYYSFDTDEKSEFDEYSRPSYYLIIK